MRARRRDGEEQPILLSSELPATLVDQPVVAVAEQNQVVRAGLAARRPMQRNARSSTDVR
jgi:hypothetical protein